MSQALVHGAGSVGRAGGSGYGVKDLGLNPGPAYRSCVTSGKSADLSAPLLLSLQRETKSLLCLHAGLWEDDTFLYLYPLTRTLSRTVGTQTARKTRPLLREFGTPLEKAHVISLNSCSPGRLWIRDN